MLRIKHIDKEGPELDAIRDLFREYEKELDENICFQSFEDELKDPLKKYGPPSGDLILAYWDDEVAGCIALTNMKDEEACEMKRLYVRPGFRKKQNRKNFNRGPVGLRKAKKLQDHATRYF